MKHLTLHSEDYRYIVQSFKEWMQTLGYNEQNVYYQPLHIQELLHYAESKGYAGLFQLDNDLIKEHYYKLRKRPNMRRGGGLSNATLNKHLDAYRLFSTYLRQSGRLQLPPLDIRTEEIDGSITGVLTLREVQQLYEVTQAPYEPVKRDRGIAYYDALQLRDRAMLTVFYGCGLRRSEGYYLDIGDINFTKQLLHVKKAKGYKERFVPFNAQALQYLQEYLYDGRPYLALQKNDAFFISYSGQRLTGAMLLLRLQRLVQLTNNDELLQKEVHLHMLRHSIATHLLEKGMRLERIAEFLGHSSLESTQIYTHFIHQQIKRHDTELSQTP